ncbi:MAG: phage tail tape measure protein [Pseudomonadota bacterium]
MASLGTLTVDLVAKIGGFVDGLSKAERQSKKFKDNVDRNIKAVGTAFTAVAIGVGVATAALVKSSIDNADALLEQSQAYGVNIELLSSYIQGAEKAGVSSTELATGLGKLSRAIDDDSDALKRLSISTKNSNGSLRDSSDVLEDIADRFASMPDGVQKTALAIDLLGKSGAKLIPFLNDGAAGLQKMEDNARRTGNVISLETAQAADQFNDNLTTMKQIITGVGNELAVELLPSLVELTDIVNDEDFQNGIKGFVGFVADGVVVAGKLAEKLASVAKYAHLLRFVGGPVGLIANAPDALDALASPSTNTSQTGTVDRSSPAPVVPPILAPIISEEELTAQKTLNDLIKDRLDGFKEQVILQGRTTELAQLQADIELGKFAGASDKDLDLLQSEAMYADSIAAEQELNQLINSRIEGYGNVINALGEMSELAKLNFDIAQGAFPSASEEDIARMRAYAESVDAIAWADKRREANEAFADIEAGLKKEIALISDTREAASLLYDLQHGAHEDFSEGQREKLVLLAEEKAAREKMFKEFQEQEEIRLEITKEFARDTQGIIADALDKPFDEGLDGLVDDFGEMLAEMSRQAIAAEITKKIFGDTSGSASGSGGGWINAIGKFAGGLFGGGKAPDSTALSADTYLSMMDGTFAGKFDGGGSIGAGQWGIAGENGAEIIRGPANITSTKDTAAMMGKSGTTFNNQFVFPNVTNKQEAQQAASVAARQINRMNGVAGRYG